MSRRKAHTYGPTTLNKLPPTARRIAQSVNALEREAARLRRIVEDMTAAEATTSPMWDNRAGLQSVDPLPVSKTGFR